MPRRPADRRTEQGGRERGSVALKVAGIVVGLILLVVVIFVAMGNFAQEVVDDNAQQVTDVREGSISAETFQAVEIGRDKQDVLEDLRPALPVEGRVLDRYEERSPETVASSCVYDDGEDRAPEEMYRFCFVEDELVDKTVVFPDADAPAG